MIITELNQTEIKVIAGGVIEKTIVVTVLDNLVPAVLKKLNDLIPSINIKVINGTDIDTKKFTTGSGKKTPDSYEGHDAEYDGHKPRKICEQ
jgi:hypothetical protein